MKRIILLILFTVHCSLFTIHCIGQAVMYQRTMSYSSSITNGVYDVLYTNDGGYALLTRDGNLSTGGVGLIKLNNLGDTLWKKVYSNIGGEYGDAKFLLCTDGGFLIYGSTYFDYDDVFLLRTNSIGDTLWSKLFVDSGWSGANFMNECSSGGFLMSGFKGYTWNANDQHDGFLIRINSIGDTLWTRTYGSFNQEGFGNFIETSDGGYMVYGSTNSFGAGLDDMWILKVDSLGNLLWNKTYGTSGNEGGKLGKSLDGNYIIVGGSSFSNAGTSNNVIILKIDAMGFILWSKAYSTQLFQVDVNFSVCADGGYILGGYSRPPNSNNEPMMLIKMDSLGNVKWSNTYTYNNCSGNSKSVIQTNDGGFFSVGATATDSVSGINAIYLVKTDSLGNSGCSQSSFALTVNAQSWVVTTPVPTIGYDSFGIQSLNYINIINPGLSINTICFTNGIDELPKETSGVLVYPNPASNSITIHSQLGITNYELRITDVFGRVVYKENIKANDTHIAISNWSCGVYFYSLTQGEGAAVRGKFIKQ